MGNLLFFTLSGGSQPRRAGSGILRPMTTTLPDSRRTTLAAFLMGVGLVAAVDEIGLHQLLAWHHFYDQSTPAVGLFSDGLFHAAQILAMIGASFMLVDLGRAGRLASPLILPAVVMGMGAFQLFDGTVNHKLLRIHQIRYEVPILPYDAVWNVVALALLELGYLVWRRAAGRLNAGLLGAR